MKIIRKIFNGFVPKELAVISHYSQVRSEIKEKLVISMAVRWNEIKRSMIEHIPVMFEHLVKIYYYHDFGEYLQGWIASVRKGFETCPKIKGKNEYPTENQIFNFIWNERLDKDISNLHQNAVKDINEFYSDVPKISVNNEDCDGFEKFFLSYLKLLSHFLSEKGSIGMQEIRNFVENYSYEFSLKD